MSQPKIRDLMRRRLVDSHAVHHSDREMVNRIKSVSATPALRNEQQRSERSPHLSWRGAMANRLRVPATANDNGDGQPAIERRSSLCQLIILFSKYTLEGFCCIGGGLTRRMAVHACLRSRCQTAASPSLRFPLFRILGNIYLDKEAWVWNGECILLAAGVIQECRCSKLVFHPLDRDLRGNLRRIEASSRPASGATCSVISSFPPPSLIDSCITATS